MALIVAGKNNIVESFHYKNKQGNLTGYFDADFYFNWREFSKDDDISFSGFWNIGIVTCRKRKHKDYNEDNHITFGGGVNFIPWYIQQTKELQDFIKANHLSTPIIVWWTDRHRRNAYVRYLTKKMGFFLTHWSDDAQYAGKKVLMWKP